MIFLKTDPKVADIYLNNQLKLTKSPARLTDLYQGRYDIRVTKDGYFDWKKTVEVTAGLATENEDIVLFLKNPQQLPVIQEETDSFNKLPSKFLNTDLEIRSEAEIWIKEYKNNDDLLVTRLSIPIKKAAYYSDKKHILFQTKNRISVMDLDGSNIIKLAELNSEDSVEFIVDDSGQFLYYRDKEEIKKLKIH